MFDIKFVTQNVSCLHSKGEAGDQKVVFEIFCEPRRLLVSLWLILPYYIILADYQIIILQII